jgi:hypothetical protein
MECERRDTVLVQTLVHKAVGRKLLDAAGDARIRQRLLSALDGGRLDGRTAACGRLRRWRPWCRGGMLLEDDPIQQVALWGDASGHLTDACPENRRRAVRLSVYTYLSQGRGRVFRVVVRVVQASPLDVPRTHGEFAGRTRHRDFQRARVANRRVRVDVAAQRVAKASKWRTEKRRTTQAFVCLIEHCRVVDKDVDAEGIQVVILWAMDVQRKLCDAAGANFVHDNKAHVGIDALENPKLTSRCKWQGAVCGVSSDVNIVKDIGVQVLHARADGV